MNTNGPEEKILLSLLCSPMELNPPIRSACRGPALTTTTETIIRLINVRVVVVGPVDMGINGVKHCFCSSWNSEGLWINHYGISYFSTGGRKAPLRLRR